MKRELLILGGDGMVGSHFIDRYADKYQITAPTVGELDITDEIQTVAYLAKFCPYAILNFAAFTNVGEGEKQRDNKDSSCWQINVEGTRNLYQHKDPSTFFLQVSTDMVFSGQNGPYAENQSPETDPTKLTWYGYTKAVAEKAIDTGADAVIRLIYPVCAHYPNKLDYLRDLLNRFDQRKLYPIFTDQQVNITSIEELCVAIDKIVDGRLPGIYHAASSTLTTPIEIYSYLLKHARGFTGELKTQKLTDFLKTVSSPVRYPLKGGLKVAQTESRLGLKYSSWQKIVDNLVSQWKASTS